MMKNLTFPCLLFFRPLLFSGELLLQVSIQDFKGQNSSGQIKAAQEQCPVSMLAASSHH